MSAHTNRIRAFTRWPSDRAERIEAAKVEVGVMGFFLTLAWMQLEAYDSVGDAGGCTGKSDSIKKKMAKSKSSSKTKNVATAIGMLPTEVRRRAEAAAAVLGKDGVPVSEWERE